ncbi:MAG: phosphotransferase [Proteobacteria bacterium]|nr:phosphotransferase [Pseudomonadota bacterium]
MDVVASGPPAFTLQQAVNIARDHYGLDVTAAVLVSERDQNFRLASDDGKRYVLKIANALEDPVVTDFQLQALLHMQAKADAFIKTPTVLRTTSGEYSFVLESEGRSHVLRIVSYLEGKPLGAAVPDAKLARNMGRYLARLGRALSDFTHPGANHSLLWDMKQAATLREILRYIDDVDMRGLARRILDNFESKILPVFDSLRWQVIHNDMNPDNVLLEDSVTAKIVGVIDFGDMARSPLIIDVAVAASYLRALNGNPLALIAEFIAGYHGENPLSHLEIDILHDLIQVRLMTSVSILSWREAARGADDAYLQAAAAVETATASFLVKISAIPGEHAAQTYRQVCASVTEIG